MAKSKRNAKRSPLDNMAWHHDQLVRDIASEIDDRELDEIAEAIMEVHNNYDRELEAPRATDHLSKEEAVDASTLASRIVDWANYGTAYGDYGDPPWENGADDNPKKSRGRRGNPSTGKWPHDTKLYSVVWDGGRRGPLTDREAVDLVRELRKSAKEAGRTTPLRITVYYRDGSAVPYADLDRRIYGPSRKPAGWRSPSSNPSSAWPKGIGGIEVIDVVNDDKIIYWRADGDGRKEFDRAIAKYGSQHYHYVVQAVTNDGKVLIDNQGGEGGEIRIMTPRRKSSGKRKKKNPEGNYPGTGAFLGSVVGGIPGHIVAALGAPAVGGVLTYAGWIAGGGAGGFYGAADDRKRRGAIGGAVGGIFTPLGAALGGYIGGTKADSKKKLNPTPGTIAIAVGAGVAATAAGYGAYKFAQKRREAKSLPTDGLEGILSASTTLSEVPYVVNDIEQPILLRSTDEPLLIDRPFERVPDLRVLVPKADGTSSVESPSGAAFGLETDALAVGGEATRDNQLVLVTQDGDTSQFQTPGKAVGQILSGLTPTYTRTVYELALLEIGRGVDWTSPEDHDDAIAKILTELAPSVDWSQGLAPYAYGSAAWKAWAAVQVLGTIANQSYFNKQVLGKV